MRSEKARDSCDLEAELEAAARTLQAEMAQADVEQLAQYKEDCDVAGDVVELAPFSLSRLERTWPWQRKAYIGRDMHCSFCDKRGHEFQFCPLRPNEKEGSSRDAHVEALLAVRQVDVLRYEGKTLEEAKAMVLELGAKFNANNALSDATACTKQLRANIGYWKAIGANNTVISWIGYGIPLRFAEQPPRLEFRSNASYFDHIDFVEEEMKKHLADGSFRVIPEADARMIHPLQVEPKRDGGLRMCVDSRLVNAYIAKPEFQLETLNRNGADVIGKDNLQFTTDLRKAYYSVEMDSEAQRYLCWRHNGIVIMSLVMIFGLSIAPMCFHKMMREVVRFLRVLGINVLNYIDDFLWTEKADKITHLLDFVRWIIPRLGWSFNEKCEWEPAKVVLFLGLLADSEKFEYRVPEDKIRRAAAVVNMLRQKAEANEPVSVNHLRSLTGFIISMQLAMPPARVWTRALYAEQAAARHVSLIRLGDGAKQELQFWDECMALSNGKPIRHPLHELTMQVDASESGWGAECAGLKRSGALPADVIGLSSTRRELVGLRLAAASLLERIAGKRLRVEMDSMAAVRNLVKGGGPKADLCQEVKDWFGFCKDNNIQPSYEWIPRERNTTADSLSKRESHAWVVKAAWRERLRQRWAIGALESDTLWCNPPFGSIAAELKSAVAFGKRVVLIVPGWPAQSWWPELMRLKSAMVDMGNVEEVFDKVEKKDMIGVSMPDWRFFAVLLDCRLLSASAIERADQHVFDRRDGRSGHQLDDQRSAGSAVGGAAGCGTSA